MEELAVEQEEENKALLELETRLVELVEAIRGLEEQVKNKDDLWSHICWSLNKKPQSLFIFDNCCSSPLS